jgi:hypothetical protein
MFNLKTKTFAICFVSLAAGSLMFSCKRSTTDSDTKALGTVKSQAVALYYPNQATGSWELSPTMNIKPGATVFTVDDEKGAPRTYRVAFPNTKVETDLVEVVFVNPQEKNAYRGYVMPHCFDWDLSKHASSDFVSGAQAVQTTNSKTAPNSAPIAPVGARNFCGI